MQPQQPAHPAAYTRELNAVDLLQGTVNLHGYPNRYLAVSARTFGSGGGLPALLAAVEWLESSGWELVNVFSRHHRHETDSFHAVVRRR